MTLSNMAPMTIGDTTWLHHGSLYPNKISLLLEPMSSPIPDDHSHHVTYKAWLYFIFWRALTGVNLHHW